MEGWNAGVKYDTLTCGCQSQVDCFRSRVNRKAYTTSSCGSRRSGLPSPLFPSGVPIVAATSPPTRVWIEDRECRVVEERADPRASFAGHVFETPWDRLQLLYFTGYANWNYFTAPFLLTQSGVNVREIGPHEEHGETWQRLQVQFPSTVPTHSAEQTFYFNEKGLLQRLDYVAEIAGAVGTHYCFDHASFSGLVFPTLRRVVGLTPTGPLISGPTVVLLLVSDIVVSTNL